MRVLLDHCVPRALAAALAQHEVQTARRMGWDELTNGKLIDAAQTAGFQVLLTTDRGFEFQQNLTGKQIGILLVKTHPATRSRLLTEVKEISTELAQVTLGQVRVFEF